jgi:hypothetical protein
MLSRAGAALHPPASLVLSFVVRYTERKQLEGKPRLGCMTWLATGIEFVLDKMKRAVN